MKELSKGQKRLSFITLLIVCMYPCFYMYFANITETTIIHVFPPLAVFLIIALLFNRISFKFTKDIYKATIVSSVIMILFMNYNLLFDMINTKFSFMGFKLFTILCCLVVLIVFLVVRKAKDDLDWVCEIICAVFAGLIVFNLFSAVPKAMGAQKNDIKPVEVTKHGKDIGFKENVYYLVLDEYGGQDNLEYYYDFDNAEFLSNMEKLGFSNSNDTFNYEGIYTKEILPNILNLEYVAHPGDKDGDNDKYLKNPMMYRFFEEMGYKINVINHQNFVDSSSDDCEEIFSSKGKNVKTNPFGIERYLYENSFLKLFQKYAPKINTGYSGYRDEVNEAFDMFAHGYEYTDGQPTFTFAYLMTPHRPFVFDENGNAIDYKDARDWEKKSVYINQLKYINKKVEEAVSNIIKNDPNAVIVVQSDHGARYGYFCMNDYSKSEFNAEVESEKMQSVLNCVYWGKCDKQEIKGLSCLNTWRTILNTLYGTDFEMIDVPKKHVVKWKYKNVME